MKIVYLNGKAEIHLEHGDQMQAAVAMLPMFGDMVTVEIIDSAPVSAPPVVATVHPAQRRLPIVAPTAPETDPAEATRGYVNQDRSRLPRPNLVYLTDAERKVLDVLREFPEGLTTAQVSDLLGVTEKSNAVSATIWRLRTQRPGPDTVHPLVQKISNRRFRITPLGAKVKIAISARPNYDNPRLGWT